MVRLNFAQRASLGFGVEASVNWGALCDEITPAGHDRPGGISPVAPVHVTDLLQRPIIASKIQCIGTSMPANFASLRAEGHWLAEYFEAVGVAPANEEAAIKVLQGIKGSHEKFHNVSYTDDAIEHAVLCANKYVKNTSLPGTAVDVIDEAGAAAQLQQGSLPKEVVEVQKRIRFIVQQMEGSIANHEFEKARSYSQEERKERDCLKQLRKKYKLDNNRASNVGSEEIERAISKLIGNFRRVICISPSAARSFVSPDSISILVNWVKLPAKEFPGNGSRSYF